KWRQTMAIQEQASVKEARAVKRSTRTTDEGKVTVGSIARYVAVAIIVFISLAPLYWTFTTSIKSGMEVTASPPTLFPQSFDLSTYATVLLNSPFFLLDLRNSAIVATITTILSLIIGVLCAYAIARTNFLGKGAVLAIILSVNM